MPNKLVLYKPGKQTGYDPKRRHYYTEAGKLITKRQFKGLQGNQAGAGPEQYGFVANLNFTPHSDVAEVLERIVGYGDDMDRVSADPRFKKASERYNELVAYVPPDASPHPIPSQIRAAMNLAEFYYNSEGDISQHVEAPIDVGMTDLDVEGEAADEVRELYDEDHLDMKHVLMQNWLLTSIYGSAYPMEVYSGKDALQVVQLPSKYVWVGYQFINENLGGSPYYLKPTNGAREWTKELAEATLQPMSYNAIMGDPNQQTLSGWGMPINPQYLRPIRSKAPDYWRYPLPSISKAFKALSNRAIYNEMRRATMEGFRNQLWLFLLGTPELPPSPGEMEALKGTVNGMTGTRTGQLVWRGGLDVKQFAVEALDNVLGNETAATFTLDVFRQLGSSIRLTTGNPVNFTGTAGEQGLEIDLSLWLRRLEYIRGEIMRWERQFRLNWATLQGDESLVKAAKKTVVRFSRSLIEVGPLIKDELQPLYTMGLISAQSALKRAGYSYEVELKEKQAGEKDRDLFMPNPTYSQTTVNPNTPEKKSGSTPQGRPAKNVQALLLAAWDDSSQRHDYYVAVHAALAEWLWDKQNPGKFVAVLKQLNGDYLNNIAAAAYQQAGGIGELDPELREFSARFVNSFADGFLKTLQAQRSFADGDYELRVMLYPQEGYKMAVLNGQAQAMEERGARHWRRIIHPELSKSGTCVFCEADSHLLHGIDEPFSVLHPNDVCGQQWLSIQYLTASGLPSIEVPVPGDRADWQTEVESVLGAGVGKPRRKRS